MRLSDIRFYAFLGVFVWMTGDSLAGISYVTQDRRIEATVRENGAADTKFSTDLGVFNASGSAKREDGNAFGYAAVSQRSILASNHVEARGNVFVQAADATTGYRSRLSLVFDIDASTPYSLRADVSGVDLTKLGGNYSGDFLRVFLRPTEAAAGEPLVDVRRSDGDVDNYPQLAVLHSSGTLSPGRYELLFEIETETFSGEQGGSYEFMFHTDAEGGPPAVPLPPAAWTGLLMLAGVAGGKAYAARRARRAELT